MMLDFLGLTLWQAVLAAAFGLAIQVWAHWPNWTARNPATVVRQQRR